MDLNPTIHAKISNNQLLELPEFKFSPFKKRKIFEVYFDEILHLNKKAHQIIKT